jgi:hypothetical protein
MMPCSKKNFLSIFSLKKLASGGVGGRGGRTKKLFKKEAKKKFSGQKPVN